MECGVQTKEELVQQTQAAKDSTAAFLKMQNIIQQAREDYEEAEDAANKYPPPPQTHTHTQSASNGA